MLHHDETCMNIGLLTLLLLETTRQNEAFVSFFFTPNPVQVSGSSIPTHCSLETVRKMGL